MYGREPKGGSETHLATQILNLHVWQAVFQSPAVNNHLPPVSLSDLNIFVSTLSRNRATGEEALSGGVLLKLCRLTKQGEPDKQI